MTTCQICKKKVDKGTVCMCLMREAEFQRNEAQRKEAEALDRLKHWRARARKAEARLETAQKEIEGYHVKMFTMKEDRDTAVGRLTRLYAEYKKIITMCGNIVKERKNLENI